EIAAPDAGVPARAHDARAASRRGDALRTMRDVVTPEPRRSEVRPTDDSIHAAREAARGDLAQLVAPGEGSPAVRAARAVAQVGASTRAMPAPTPAAAAPAQQSAAHAPELDIDQIARDIYQEILAMMDAARDRNGEPYR